MNTIVSLKDPFVNTCSELLPSFGIDYKFQCELMESSLNSGEPVNIIAGLTNGLKGNVVLGLSNEAAFQIVSGMMGGMPVNELNEMTKSALSEFMMMLCGTAIGKIKTEEIIRISSPTLVIGKKIFLMISKAPAKKIFFKMGDTKFNIAYCLE